MLPSIIVYLSIPASIIAYFFYLRNIIRGHTKPNLISWFLWMLPALLGAFFQVKAGAGLAALPVAMAGLGPVCVIIFSIFKRNAFWRINSFDLICGSFSLLALIIYLFTQNLGISIFFAILSDTLAFFPVFLKSWHFPETETSSVYFVGLFNNTLGLLIITDWSFAVYSFVLYLVVSNIIELSILYRKKIFKIS